VLELDVRERDRYQRLLGAENLEGAEPA